MYNRLLDRLHQTLSRRRLFVRLAIRLRNQAKCIIKYHICESSDLLRNGEAALIQLVAPYTNTFIDVGANVGNWTNMFLKHSPYNVTGILFEPSVDAVAQLKVRFSQHPQLEIVDVAIADTQGNMPFYEQPNSGEGSTLVRELRSSAKAARRVTISTLDLEMYNRGFDSIDFLKVDTEGYDLRVLHGASGLLSRQQIGLIQFEYNSMWASANSTLAGANHLLESYGYRIFLLRQDGLFDFDYSTYGEFFTYCNFVAVPSSRLKLIQSLIKGKL
jgi:FkbM family methyltransferase